MLNRVRYPAETSLVVASFEDMDFGDGHLSSPLRGLGVSAQADVRTPIRYLDAGVELPNCFAMARRAASKRVHWSPSWRLGSVTTSPWSSPTRAASTMSSADITIDAGRFWYGRPAFSQISVAVAAGSTTWMRTPFSASSCCSAWLSAMT